MLYSSTYIFSGIQNPTIFPPERNHQHNSSALNRIQLIPPKQLALQPPIPNVGLPSRAISFSQPPPLPIFKYNGVGTPILPPPMVQPLFNRNTPTIYPSAGSCIIQEGIQQPTQQQYNAYPMFNMEQIRNSWRSPVIQVPMDTAQLSAFQRNTAYALPSYSTMPNRTPAYIAIQTATHPMGRTYPHRTHEYVAAQPEYAMVEATIGKTENIDTSKSTLNPNTTEFVPGQPWHQPIPASLPITGKNIDTPELIEYLPDLNIFLEKQNLIKTEKEPSQFDSREFEEEGVIKDALQIVRASEQLKNSREESNEVSAFPSGALETHTPELHSNNSTEPRSKEVNKTPEHRKSSLVPACVLDGKEKILLVRPKPDKQPTPETTTPSIRRTTQVSLEVLLKPCPEFKPKMDTDIALLYAEPLIDQPRLACNIRIPLARKFEELLNIVIPNQSHGEDTRRKIEKRNMILTCSCAFMDNEEKYKKTKDTFDKTLKALGQLGRIARLSSLEVTPVNLINMILVFYIYANQRKFYAGKNYKPFFVRFCPADTFIFDIQLPQARKKRQPTPKIDPDIISQLFNDTTFIDLSSSIIEILTETFKRKIIKSTGIQETDRRKTTQELSWHIKLVTTLTLTCKLHLDNTKDPLAVSLFLNVLDYLLTHIETIYPYRNQFPDQYMELVYVKSALLRSFDDKSGENPFSDPNTNVQLLKRAAAANERSLTCFINALEFSMPDVTHFGFTEDLIELFSKVSFTQHLGTPHLRSLSPSPVDSIPKLSTILCSLIQNLDNMLHESELLSSLHSHQQYLIKLREYWLPMLTQIAPQLFGNTIRGNTPEKIQKHLKVLEEDQVSSSHLTPEVRAAIARLAQEVQELNKQVAKASDLSNENSFIYKLKREVDELVEKIGELPTFTQKLTERKAKATKPSFIKSREEKPEQAVLNKSRSPSPLLAEPEADPIITKTTQQLQALLKKLTDPSVLINSPEDIEALMRKNVPDSEHDDSIRFWVYTDCCLTLLSRDKKEMAALYTRINMLNRLYQQLNHALDTIPFQSLPAPREAFNWLKTQFPNRVLSLPKVLILEKSVKLESKDRCRVHTVMILSLMAKANNCGQLTLDQLESLPSTKGRHLPLLTKDQLVCHLETLKNASAKVDRFYQTFKAEVFKKELVEARSDLFDLLGIGPNNPTNLTKSSSDTTRSQITEIKNILKEDESYLTSANGSRTRELDSAKIAKDSAELLHKAKGQASE